MVHNPLDQALLLQMSDRNPRQRAVDLEPLNEDALGDEPEGGHFLDDTVVQGLVERNSVLGLVLDLALGPLLLLCCLSTARGCGCCLSFGLQGKNPYQQSMSSDRDPTHPAQSLCLSAESSQEVVSGRLKGSSGLSA